MMDQGVRNNLRTILLVQVAISSICILVCTWRFISVYSSLYVPPPHTVAARYYALRMEQLNVYMSIVVVITMIVIDRIINFWLVTRKMHQAEIRFGRRTTDIISAISGKEEDRRNG